MDAEALVRLPEITDAQEIARTKNDSWRVGYRGLLPDSILGGLDDARSTTQWVQWLRDGYENAGLRAEVRVTTAAARQVVGVSAFGADRDLPNDANRGELWVLYVASSHSEPRVPGRAAPSWRALLLHREVVRSRNRAAGWRCRAPIGRYGAAHTCLR